MTRRLPRLLVAVFALLLALGVAPQVAAAQDDVDIPSTSIDDRSRDLGLSFVSPDIQPSSDPSDTSTVGGTGGPGLAATGVESEAITAISIGLLAVGGSALVSSRRRVRDLFLND